MAPENPPLWERELTLRQDTSSGVEATAPRHSRDTLLQLRLKAGDGSEQSPAPLPAFAAAQAFA